MANIKSSKKRAKQAVVRNLHNSSQASTLRTAIKKVRKAVADGDKDQAKAAFHASQSLNRPDCRQAHHPQEHRLALQKPAGRSSEGYGLTRLFQRC